MIHPRILGDSVDRLGIKGNPDAKSSQFARSQALQGFVIGRATSDQRDQQECRTTKE